MVVVGAQLISGVAYDKLNESISNVVKFVIVPIAIGILAVFALTARGGWWHEVFHEPEL